MLAWRCLGAALCAALLLPACGDDSPPPPPPPGDSGRRDTGGLFDTGADAADSAVDTSVLDTGPDDGSVTGDCMVTDMLTIHTEPATAFRQAELSVGVGLDGFLVGYVITRDGQENLYTRHVGTSGTTIGAEENVSRLDLTMPGRVMGGAMAGLDAGWLLVWPDSRRDLPGDLTFDIQLATAMAGGGGIGAVTAVTNDTDAGDDRPTLQFTADGYLMVWNRRLGGPTAVDEAYRVTLSPAGAVTGTPGPVAGMTGMSGRVALGALTDGVAGAWVEDVGVAERAVMLLAMDRDGTPRGSPTTVTLTPNAAGIVDYSGVIDGGGVVYDYIIATSRNDVRYRAINAEGGAASEPISLVPPPAQGRAPSIGIVGGAALVAYRSNDSVDGSTIQLVVVDGFGREVTRTTVASVETWTNGEVHVLFTPLGQGLIVWNDVVGGDYVINGARIDCSGAP